MRRLSSTLSFSAFVGTLLGACGGDDFNDCRDNSTCPPADASAGRGGTSGNGGRGGNAGMGGAAGTGGSNASGGTDGAAGSAGATGGTSGTGPDTGCDLSKSLTEDMCAVTEAYGVFVSAAASDAATGNGTREAPYKTIEEGMTAAKRSGKRVYVCADGGNYTAQINVGTALDGLELYGGFRCEDWQYNAALKAPIVTVVPNAVYVTGLQIGLKLEDFAITAADATIDGGSSFGVIVANSRNVVLRRVRVTAGAGKAGANGGNGAPGAVGADAVGMGLVGKPAECGGDAGASHTGGGWSAASSCGSQGGTGGVAHRAADTNGGDGVAGSPRTNVTPPNSENGGLGQTSTRLAQAGTTGSPGNSGSNGGAASATGTFTATGFTPASGNDGTNGFPGQGGGGGGASKGNGPGNGNCIGASGGAGGMGGCGGAKGVGGGGGGASVAVLSWMSEITLDATQLVAKNGGAGGKGGNAGDGGGGGGGAVGGAGVGGIGAAGRGGDGGRGGLGGSGSGGTGGPSHALVVHGTAPVRSNAPTLMAATGGAKGVGGMVTGGVKASDGSDGASALEYSQP